jgi:thiaminase/transcriptional activator TenA
MSFSQRLRRQAQRIWDAQLTHPFVVSLGNGTLPERKFRYYILQDARFLGELARVFSAGALRAPDSESALRLTKLAEETIVVVAVAQSGSAAEITVVALPCAWIYCVVGRHLLRNGRPPKSHPYRDWLMLYASPEFAEVQQWMRKKVDQWAKTAGEEERRRMEESFVISSRYEWMFWEMAWNEEKWPV